MPPALLKVVFGSVKTEHAVKNEHEYDRDRYDAEISEIGERRRSTSFIHIRDERVRVSRITCFNSIKSSMCVYYRIILYTELNDLLLCLLQRSPGPDELSIAIKEEHEPMEYHD